MTVRWNLGCGRDIRDRAEWTNVDGPWNPDADLWWDFDGPSDPWGPSETELIESYVDEAYASHVLEHLHDVLRFMERLHHWMKPDGVLVVRAPYGSSDDADTDPTHVRRLFKESWAYFGQPNYWRADYGYRGDWRVEEIELTIHPRIPRNTPPAALDVLLLRDRNVVVEQVVLLRAVKPIREPLKELADKPILTAKWVTT